MRTFEVHSVTVGEDAQGEALLTVEHNGRSYRGAGISTNILESAARAYLEVINRIEATKANAGRGRLRAWLGLAADARTQRLVLGRTVVVFREFVTADDGFTGG